MEKQRDIEDVVRALGYLCLGSRFKRIGERLQAGTQQILARLDTEVPAAQFPILAAIDRLGALTVGEMAQALGVSQPGITRSLLQLRALGMVDIATSTEDGRQRVVSLTAAGRDLVMRSKAGVWAEVAAAVAELCADLDGPLLEQLSTIEDRLAETGLKDRGKSHDAPA